MQNYQQIPRQNKCPVCGTMDATILWVTSSNQSAQHFVLHEKHPTKYFKLVSQIESIWGQNKCEVIQCDGCGFCYSNPYIAGDSQFYDLAYDRSSYPTWKWEFLLTYNILNKFSKSDLTLLEIGAGNGAFIRRIANKILLKENILCTEFSKYGKNQIENMGVKCLSDDVRNLSNIELKGTFDIVCMFQVLEHMDKLDILFQKLNWLMKKGGSLFIAVPNPKLIEFNELNGALLDMPPNHIGRWNIKCFEVIAQQYGFKIEDHKVEKFSLTSVAKQFITYRYLRNSQQNGTFENKIEQINNKYLLKLIRIPGVLVNLIQALPSLFKMNSGLGNSQWVHLIKLC